MSKGGQPGNNNAGKNKLWTEAIRKTVIQRKSLDKMAKKLVAKAEEGDMLAIKEIGDRLDGKAAQGIIVSGDEDQPLIHRVERIIVDVTDTDR